jgi:hypothetical protein
LGFVRLGRGGYYLPILAVNSFYKQGYFHYIEIFSFAKSKKFWDRYKVVSRK